MLYLSRMRKTYFRIQTNMAAIFMKGKSNVFSSEAPPKSFYYPSLPRQLATEFSMTHGNKPSQIPSGGVPRKSHTTAAEIEHPRSASYDVNDTENTSGSRVDGLDPKDSTLAKYIERFRRAKPSSRETREVKQDHCFWWKDNEPCTPPHPVESPVLQPPSSTPQSIQTPSTLSSLSCIEKDLDKCEELIDKSEAVLRSNSFPILDRYSTTPLTTPHQPPLPTVAQHEDILHQWRLRRKLEQAHELVHNHSRDLGIPGCSLPQLEERRHERSKTQSWCHGNNDLASTHTSTCFSTPTSCCTGMQAGSAIPERSDGDLKTQDVACAKVFEPVVSVREKHQLLVKEDQPPMKQHQHPTEEHKFPVKNQLQSTGTQTADGTIGASSCSGGPPPITSSTQPKPSILYPDSSFLTRTGDNSLDNSVDTEQSFSISCDTTTNAHPPVSECVEHQLLQTTPHSIARHAGAVLISSSSSDSLGSMEDELLHLLIVRARLLETQLRQIDYCLTAAEECST